MTFNDATTRLWSIERIWASAPREGGFAVLSGPPHLLLEHFPQTFVHSACSLLSVDCVGSTHTRSIVVLPRRFIPQRLERPRNLDESLLRFFHIVWVLIWMMKHRLLTVSFSNLSIARV